MSVYTSLNQSQLNELLSPYPFGELIKFEGIAEGIENTNYRIHTTANNYILTIFEQHKADDVHFYLKLLSYLKQQGLPVPQPIPTTRKQHQLSWQSKPVVLFEHLSGQSITTPQVNHCRQLGQALAQFHLSGQLFPLTRKNNRDGHWLQQIGRTLLKRSNTISSHSQFQSLSDDDAQLLTDELTFQKKQDFDHLPRGTIHADLFRDNVLFEQGILSGLLDFYTACQGPLLFDLAIIVNDWCITPEYSIDLSKANALFDTYEKFRPLTSHEKQLWPVILRTAALRFWLSRLLFQQSSNPGELTQDKDPDVLKYCLLNHRQKTSLYRS